MITFDIVYLFYLLLRPKPNSFQRIYLLQDIEVTRDRLVCMLFNLKCIIIPEIYIIIYIVNDQ